MATDYRKLMTELHAFYDFTEKIVLFVGAGGGQLLDPTVKPKTLVAIDQDAAALAELEKHVAARGRQDSMEIICARFEGVTRPADVVYFEFCLHEMNDPLGALRHARRLAPDIVVFDHSPGSEWAFYAAEEDKVGRSAETMAQFTIRQSKTYRTDQRFGDYEELLAKIGPQGRIAIDRVQRFVGTTNIIIPMDYGLTLL